MPRRVLMNRTAAFRNHLANHASDGIKYESCVADLHRWMWKVIKLEYENMRAENGSWNGPWTGGKKCIDA